MLLSSWQKLAKSTVSPCTPRSNSATSASVGFWPSERMMVPTSRRFTVPWLWPSNSANASLSSLHEGA